MIYYAILIFCKFLLIKSIYIENKCSMSLANHFYSDSLSIYIYVQSHYLHVIRINLHYQSICLFVTETNYSNRGVKNFKNLTTFLFDRWLSKYTSRSKLTGKTANWNMQFAGTTLTKYIFYIYMYNTHLWSWFFFYNWQL